MEAFSMDLRQRIWDALNQRGETGDTLEEIAKRFQVSRQWLSIFGNVWPMTRRWTQSLMAVGNHVR